jgi:hypothetical protein
MKSSFFISLFGLSLSSLVTAQTIFQVDLRGHASLLSNDRPVQRGRLALFHRYPDGVFLSVPEDEIVRVVTASASPSSKTLLPGEAIDVGPTGGGHPPDLPTQEGSAGTAPASDSGPYGPMNSSYYDYGSSPRNGMGMGPGRGPIGPVVIAPPVIGPNGYPTMNNPSAQRGSR